MKRASWQDTGMRVREAVLEARRMCAHSLERARQCGFRAMQFNFVVGTNERAVRLWQSFGFEIVGRLPKAFAHPTPGFADAYVVYRQLWSGLRSRARCATHAACQILPLP